jgi:GNAT superfamily N-acetyltransferase
MKSRKPEATVTLVEDAEDIRKLLFTRIWGDRLLMGGRMWRCEDFLALSARDSAGVDVGLAVFAIRGTVCFLFMMDSGVKGSGLGDRFLRLVKEAALKAGARTVRALTPNDHTDAMRFYQRRGFRFTAIYPGAIDVYRLSLPHVPVTGFHGIPLRDTLELELEI